jgi:hypothetical protein
MRVMRGCTAFSRAKAVGGRSLKLLDPVIEGVTMLPIVLAVTVVVLGGVIAFLFGPTIKALLGQDFEPAPKDDASVRNAITTRMVDGGQ